MITNSGMSQVTRKLSCQGYTRIKLLETQGPGYAKNSQDLPESYSFCEPDENGKSFVIQIHRSLKTASIEFQSLHCISPNFAFKFKKFKLEMRVSRFFACPTRTEPNTNYIFEARKLGKIEKGSVHLYLYKVCRISIELLHFNCVQF